MWEYLKNCYFSTKSAAFPGKSTNLLLLNYVKPKLFNQLLRSQFIVANTLVSLDCLNLLRTFNFLDISQKHCSFNIFNFKIRLLISHIYELTKTQRFLLSKTYIFELKANFFFTVTKKWPYSLPFFQKRFYIKFVQ